MHRAMLLNAGSSTLKWAIAPLAGREEIEASGAFDWNPTDARACDEAVARVVREHGPVEAAAHRVVHGGDRFRESVRITPTVRSAIALLADIDPLHAPVALAGIDAVTRALPDVPQIAAFDTAFHATIPESAARYAIPRSWRDAHGIRRYGFHGLSVAHAVRRASEMLDETPQKVVVCHLGSGCSATAVANGLSVDTTMGFTPLEGMVMGTRSGSVDPGALTMLLRRGISSEALDRGLEHESGLLALAGTSDFRVLSARAEAGDLDARSALSIFAHSVVRNVGALVAVLGGLDALVFTGGIGEHAPSLRSAVAERFAFAGIRVDPAANERAQGDADVSARDARARTLVITAREELVLLAETRRLLSGSDESATPPSRAP